ncbi:MAG: hypothetical protein QXD86_05860 [Candidatus Bathyarchaeia archaeon]
MKYSVEILRLGSDPRLTLEEKMPKVKELIEKALSELNITLFFIENVLTEAIESVV